MQKNTPTNSQYVSALYKATLGREPSANEIELWLEKDGESQPLDSIASSVF